MANNFRFLLNLFFLETLSRMVTSVHDRLAPPQLTPASFDSLLPSIREVISMAAPLLVCRRERLVIIEPLPRQNRNDKMFPVVPGVIELKKSL